jgi:predicted amidohydrolase YtcJ
MRLRSAWLVLACAAWESVGIAAESCPGGRDRVLSNGQILTVDPRDTQARSVRIRGNRIVAVDAPVVRGERCVDVIDLGGRTVIPGLIDNHTHFIRTAQAPGPFVEGLESADSIAALQAAFAVAAKKAEPGEWVTAIGGFTHKQFREQRLPTRQELTAAVPDHPVYIQIGYSTRGLVNDMGRRVLKSAGIDTSESGDVSTDGKGLTYVLRSTNEAWMRRRFTDYMRYGVSLGITGVVDHACCDWLGAHLAPEERPTTAIAEDLWRRGDLLLRLRLQYDHRDTRDQADIHSASARVANTTRALGDDMFRVVRFGEQTIPASAPDAEVLAVYQRLARAGWAVSQHTIKHDEIERYLKLMEQVNAQTALQDLRWTLEHAFEITPDQIARLKAIGVGVRVQDHDYIRNTNSSWNPGPPYRTLLESGIQIGAGSDSAVVGVLNPWLGFWFMTTGKDAGDELLLPGQQISRKAALRLYTAQSAWFNFEEKELGSIEVGKLADVVVLDKPFYACTDEELKHMRPLLTMVGGRVVYGRETFAKLAH